MKTKQNIPLTILAACNKVMDMFIPLAVVLLLINATELTPNSFGTIVLLIVALCSTLFRALKVWVID